MPAEKLHMLSIDLLPFSFIWTHQSYLLQKCVVQNVARKQLGSTVVHARYNYPASKMRSLFSPVFPLVRNTNVFFKVFSYKECPC